MAERKRITGSTKKPPSKETKKRRLEKKWEEWNQDYDTQFCWNGFIVAQLEKGNSKYTISFYRRFFTKYTTYLNETYNYSPNNVPIEMLTTDTAQYMFMDYMRKQGLNQQTVNSYLRAYRAFGNWCEEEGYLDGFKCPIKEVEPPVKQVYTDKELAKLMAKPPITDFADYRAYCIIMLILNTGARSNTILNIRLCDLDLEEGYISFNTTKTNKIVRLGLERKTKRDLSEWLYYWRINKGAEPTDYLFCNQYGEKLSRSSLCKAIEKYNHSRGVEKTSIHLLRHTFAKMWITSGGDIISLAKVLTHSEHEMVKRYSNLYGTDIKKEIEQHSAISQLKQQSGKTLKTQKRKLDDFD